MCNDQDNCSDHPQLQAEKVAELLEEIHESRKVSARMEEAARSLAGDSRAVQDVAATAEQLYESAPDEAFSSAELDVQIGVWRSVNERLRTTLDSVEMVTRT